MSTGTVLNGYIHSIISKIENGYNDVATLTPDVEGIPFRMKSWIQIAGPLFYEGAKDDDIYVCICLDGCNSEKLEIYQRFGFKKEQNDAGLTKYYKQSEADKIAEELEEIVVTLIGEVEANKFISDEEFTRISHEKVPTIQVIDAKKQMKKKLVFLLIFSLIIVIVILGVVLISGEL